MSAFFLKTDMAGNYDRYLGPFMFEPFARDLATKARSTSVQSVLETGCGTGRLTYYLRRKYPDASILIATDLSEDMMAIAKEKLKGQAIIFQQADAQALPFADDSFDVIACQFGMMFLPDRQKGFAEAYRVLKSGGQFIFNTWDRVDNQPFFDLVFNEHVIPYAKDKPAEGFLTPFSMYGTTDIHNGMQKAGFKDISVSLVTLMVESPSARDLSYGFFVPKSSKEEENPALTQARLELEKDIGQNFGDHPVRTELRAWACEGMK